MGEVYKARDTRLDRPVALKILAAAIASDAEFRSRFEREARAISALKHPHICVLYDVGSHGAIDYLVLEYLEGQTLAERLRGESRGLELSDALRIALGVADALDAAHRHGIVHRDLKPGNVMLTAGGPKLLDFGLAKQGGSSAAALSGLDTRAASVTAEGVIVGTLQYMAPEQIEGHQVDARTDVFALGAVIYEMVAGRKAFEAQSQASLIAKILQVDPPAVSTIVPVSPPALDRLVQRCLAKNPDDRWQSVRDVFLELRWILEESEKAPRVTRHAATWRQWLPWAIAALVAVFAVSMWTLRPAQPEVMQPLSRFDVPLPPGVLPLALNQGPPALSPDGRSMAVSATMDGRLHVLLRRLDQTAFVPVPGTDGGRVPFWSPDSGTIGFFAGRKLRRVAISGGPVLPICDVTDNPFGGSWNGNGVILFDSGGVIYRVAESGGTPEAVTSLDRARGETAHRYPQFLPDGRSFLFTALGARREVRAATLDSPSTQLVVADASEAVFAPPASLLVLRGQNVVVAPFDAARAEVTGTERSILERVAGGLSASRNGTLLFRPAGLTMTQLQRFTRDGRKSGGLGTPGPYQQLALSPSGRRLALQRGEFTTTAGIGTSNIWILDLTTGIHSKLTADPRYEADPSWSPDERSLAFTTAPAGNLPNLFRKDLTTGIEEPLADSRGNLDEWTPDGRFAIFRREGRTIVAVPLAGERTPRTIVDRPLVIHDQSHVSPDGRWIAFNSNESGRWEVHAARFPDFTDKHQISNDGGVQPLWRRDGEELFYLDLRGQVMSVAVRKERPDPFGVPRPLFRTALNPSPYIGEYAVTGDGERFLVLEPAGGPPAALAFVLNWRPVPAE